MNLSHTIAQYNENWKRAAQTNTKYEQNPSNTFTKKQNTWLLKNDFNIATYKWDNPKINKHLRTSVGLKSGGNFFGVSGIIAGAIDDPDKRESFKKRSSNALIASGLLLTTSITFTIGAKNQVKKANQLK